MSSSTPVGKRVKLSNEATQSPLGMLAALASPSSPIRNPAQPLGTSLLAIASNTSTPKPAHSNNKRAFEVDSTPSIDAGAFDMQTPTLKSGYPERPQRPSSRSASPIYSPSSRAARRRTLQSSPRENAAVLGATSEAFEALEQSEGTPSPDGSASARSSIRPSAIPATQLDVLALVTATSPPMPSRRRWTGHSTPRRAPSRTSELCDSPKDNDSKKRSGSGSGSDTVSEDEDQLRSHSARLKERYRSVQMRTLPGTPPVANLSGVGNGARSEHNARTYPIFYAQGQRQPSATPLRAQVGSRAHAAAMARPGRTSEGESTTTDEEVLGQSRTPALRRVPASSHRISAAPLPLPQSSDKARMAATFAPLPGLAPASEPALRRRTRPRADSRPFGVALSKQLAELAEETEETENDGSGTCAINPMRGLSASISPLPSPSQHRRSQPHTKRLRARTNGQRSGSETETDNERDTATQRAGRSMSISSNDGSAHVAGAVSLGQQRRIITRPQHNGGPALFNGHTPRSLSRNGQQPRLSPATPLGAPASRQGGIQPLPPAPAGGDSGGETTETDDDFFGNSRSFHYSIRPPRRVVRQLASLRSRNLQPAALDLHSQTLPTPSYHPHTAPIVGSDSGANDAFGLGISGPGNCGGSFTGPARIVSTPISSSIAQGPLGSPGPPPLRQQPVAYRQAGEQRAYPMHNSSMRREFAQDPFAPMPDEFTYKGAALRRLERTHNRGAPTGNGSESSANRKRALTAPSSFEPPLVKRSMHGYDTGGAPVSRGYSGVSSPEMPSEHVVAPTEPRHQIGGRPGLLGESPVSSLRSSLFTRAIPASLVSSSTSSSSSLCGARQSMHNGSQPRLVGASHPTAENVADPTESSSRKRRHSSVATRLQLQAATPPTGIKPIEESPTFSFSSLNQDTARSPQSSDVLFPPIDSGSS
ncbi:hypothetical protein IWW39_002634 [Coemansia spiralis]|uniref:Uncharacterized protein n=1 Tax=Coemansia spiralis TaxID=417178 RepID=A0A9W8L518_9FUNG|nr:hypothetical protein IWW39_002634 [Coemansia spiralis]